MKKIGILSKCFVIAIALIIVGNKLTNSILEHYTIVAKAETVSDSIQAIGINVTNHTEDEIRNYLISSGAIPENPVFYKESPSTKALFKAGSLTDETLNSAIKMLNQIRYIAGISYNVTLNEENTAKAQAASLVNSVNGKLSHSPEKPSDMADSLYQLGAQGAGSSNLAAGYDTINRSLVYGYMNDGDSSNIDRVGHRRWILNPKMSATGFGYCEGYSALYVFDGNNKSASEYGVAWPAQTMPTDYFGVNYPWSVSMGYEVNEESVRVTLIRISDNKTWNFSSSATDGYFNVNNDGYGQSGCIVFRPDDINNGDQFQVTITGLNAPVSYQVSFFDLIPVTSVAIKKNDTKIIKGAEIYLESIVTPSDASNQSIKWTSSDEKIAAVSEYGGVEGKSYGTATITATSFSSGLTATTKVTISGLKNGQVYYVKIRSYVLIKGQKIYSDYGYSDSIWVTK